MLHFLLLILKIIGILLLVLLLLVILLLAIVLLVPVRYSGTLKRTETDKAPNLQLRLSWLLRAIRIEALVIPGKKPETILKVFGRRLGGTGRRTEDDRADGPGKAHREDDEADAGDQPQGEKSPDPDTERMDNTAIRPEQVLSADEDENWPEQAWEDRPAETEELPKETLPADKETLSADKEKTSAKEEKPEEDAAGEGNEKGRAERKKGNGLKEKAGALKKLPGRITEKIGGAVNKARTAAAALVVRTIEWFFSILTDVLDLLFSLTQPEPVPDRLRGLLEKPAQLKALADRYEVGDILSCAVRAILKMLRRYRPRKMKGYTRFGTGDPSVTGIVYGVCDAILPDAARDYELEPDFYEACFETDTEFSGHVRVCHAVRALLTILCRRKTIRLIKALLKRKKGE